MVPIIGGLQARLAAMQYIQNLLHNLNKSEYSKTVEDEVVDSQEDLNLTKPEQANHPGPSLSIGIRFTIGSLDIGFMLHLTKEQGKENAPDIGLEALGEQGQTMRGILGELPEQDQQGSFTPEAWGKVQGNRKLCIKAANQGLQAQSGQAEKGLSK